MRFDVCGLVGVLALAAAPSAAEIYRWTDENGRVHFTQDLSKVPARHRAAAEDAAQKKPGPSPIQVYKPPASRRKSPVTKSASATIQPFASPTRSARNGNGGS